MKKKNKNMTESVSVTRYTPDISKGLTEQEVKDRDTAGLKNNTKVKASKSVGKIIVESTFSVFSVALFLIGIFLFLCNFEIIPGVVPEEGSTAVFPITKFTFLVPIICSILISIIQQLRSKHIIEKLELVNRHKYQVIREGIEYVIETTDIVVDDIIKLKSGTQIPCDSLLLDGEVEVDESLLTGESQPVKKHAGDELLSGSCIVSGSCTITAVKVGKDTFAYSLQEKMKKANKNKSELMKNIYSIERIATVILVIMTIISSVVMALKLKSYPDMLTLTKVIEGVSVVAINLMPSGLILMASITLAVSIINLAKKDVLIQDLYSLENLSRVDTICFDKTGTLTTGTEMTLEEVNVLDKKADIDGYLHTFCYAIKDRNATLEAIARSYEPEETYKVSSIENFTSANKCSKVTLENGVVLCLGAPEFIVNKQAVSKLKMIEEKASEGIRVLAFTVNKKLVALLYLSDTIRESAPRTIQYFNEHGVDVKIISGDNPATVSYIAGRCGVKGYDKYINMQEVADEDIPNIVEEYSVFGRIKPEQKELVVKALQAKGRIVAVNGDGVNDATALKAADASITFESATDAAKSVSDVILLDNSLDHLDEVIGQGRRVTNNIVRTAILFLSKNFFMLFAALFSFFLPQGICFISIENLFLYSTVITGIGGFLLGIEGNTKQPITGHFKQKVYPKSIICGLLLAISVAIANFTCGDNLEMMRAFTATAVAVGGLCILTVISFPITKYKLTVWSIVTFLVILAMLIYPRIFLLADTGNIVECLKEPFGIEDVFGQFTREMWEFFILYAVIFIPIYNGISSMSGTVFDKYNKK